MTSKINILIIPLDNRPVSYSLPIQIGKINDNVNIIIPPREYLGGLTHNSDIDKIIVWLTNTLEKVKIDAIVCALDTIAYGGLIPSRRSSDLKDEITSRLDKFKKIILKHPKYIRFYAFSSILRISNNNINEEEKEYWDKFGELLFRYSYLTHKSDEMPIDAHELESITKQIPDVILDDYLETRKRNFAVNNDYIKWLKEDFIDYLVFSQDDTAKWGLNVREAKFLTKTIIDSCLLHKATVQTGADEILLDLLTRSIREISGEITSIYPVFSTESGKNVISRYEDRTILESVIGQIGLCRAYPSLTIDDADLILLVHTPVSIQNDHALGVYPEQENDKAVEFCIDFIKNSKKPVILADLSHANGSDNSLVRRILDNNLSNNIYGYAGWNTTGNTLGSAISMGICRYIAQNMKSFNLNEFKKLLLIRLADDWAYQSIVRQKIRSSTSEPDTDMLKKELEPMVINIAENIDLLPEKIELSFPWNRTFEVEIKV